MEIGLVESEAQNDILSFEDEIRNKLHFEKIVGRSAALQTGKTAGKANGEDRKRHGSRGKNEGHRTVE